MKINSPNLTFKLFGVLSGLALLIATTFTFVYTFLNNGYRIVTYYIVASVFQVITLILLHFFMFYKDGLFFFWKKRRLSNNKALFIYPFIVTLLAAFACIFAIIVGIVEKGWIIVAGYSIPIVAASYILEIVTIAGGIPSIIMLPLWFDRNK